VDSVRGLSITPRALSGVETPPLLAASFTRQSSSSLTDGSSHTEAVTIDEPMSTLDTDNITDN